MYNEKRTIFLFTRQRAAAAIIAAAVFVLSIVLSVAGDGFNLKYVLICSLLALFGILVIFMDFYFSSFLNHVLILLIPVISFAALENFTNSAFGFPFMIIILNLMFFYLFYGFFSFLLGNTTRGYYTATFLIALFGIINYFVFSFRGSPIVPWDFYSIRTAFSVAGNYSFTIFWKACCSVFLFIWSLIILSKTITERKKIISRILFTVVLLCGIIFYTICLQSDDFRAYFGMETRLFAMNDVYKKNGTVPSFLMNLGLIDNEEPDGYSTEEAEAIVEPYINSETSYESEDITDYPNIIVIMNEAFSDLSVYGDFTASEDVLLNFHELQKEGVSGNLYVSVNYPHLEASTS